MTSALALPCGCASEAHPGAVLVVIETAGAEHAETPALARLAAEGVFYADAFAHGPDPLVARAALLSARTPLEAGIALPGPGLPAELPTLGAWLAEHGYRPVGSAADAPRGEPFFLSSTLTGDHGSVDRAFAQLRAELEQRGAFDRSLVVVTTLRGGATGLSDADLRAPVILKPPAGHPLTADLERARDKTVRHIDVAPTVLDVLGLPELPGRTGTSLLEGTLRVHLAERRGAEPAVSLRDDRYKLVHRPGGGFEMFDLEADPGETTDVFAERGDERAAWQRALRKSAERLAGLGGE